jgi:uncharacterized protein (DUF1015 family)
MLEIRPFPAVIYNSDKIDNLTKVTTPPYDVISPEEQDFYYTLDPYNIIRIILGKDFPHDSYEKNKYSRAARFFREWLKVGILKEEKDPAIYVYDQEYTLREKRKKRRGFMALMRLEDLGSGVVFPHEETFPGPEEDRLMLLKRCQANLSPIFSLYSDPSFSLDECLKVSETLANLKDRDGVGHRLGRIRDEDKIIRICQIMKDEKIFIADGHHRYKTALAFRNEERERSSSPRGEDFVLMYFLNMESDAVTVLPVHRVLRNLSFEELARIKSRIKDFFRVQILERKKEDKTAEKEIMQMIGIAEGPPRFGMYLGDDKYYILTLKRKPSLLEVDSAILDRVLKEILKNKTLRKGEEIDFVKDAGQAVNLVEKGTYQMTLLLKPLSLKKLKEVCLSGRTMPPKTSYFYPKLLTGILMRDLKDGV